MKRGASLSVKGISQQAVWRQKGTWCRSACNSVTLDKTPQSPHLCYENTCIVAIFLPGVLRAFCAVPAAQACYFSGGREER